jgi:hypothetical protein
MAVTTTNLTAGPGTLYTGTFGATEPTDAEINTTPAATAWRDVGGTSDGVTISVNQEFMALSVDQVIDVVERRRTGRDVQVSTNLAETTLENLAFVLNGGTQATGANFKSYDPDMADSATQPVYFALLFDGWAPYVANAPKRRRVVARKCINIEGVEVPYKKDAQTLYPVTFGLHYVSSSVKPFRVIDQTT